MRSIEQEKHDILTIKIEYKETLSLFQFKEVLEGLNNQYSKKISEPENDEKLLIREIRQGSIIMELISSALPLITEYNNIYTFFTAMKSIINWFITKKGVKPKVDINDIENLRKLITPITTNDSSINFSVQGDNNEINYIVINKEGAQAIAHNLNEELTTLMQKAETIEDTDNFENMVLKLKQVEDTEKNNKNTKGIINEISEKAYPILAEPDIKLKIIHDPNNPLRKNYLVHGKANNENGKITSYTILKILDSYDDDIEEDASNSLFP